MLTAASYTQENRKLGITTPLGADALLLRSFEGSEAVSRLFRFDLDLLSEDDAIDFAALIGRNVTVRMRLADESERLWNGVISRFSQGGQDGRFTRYRAEMVPWLWFFTRVTDCRIFQRKTIPEIVEELFREAGFFDYVLQLSGSFPKREYRVQYRESTFSFISRLLEDEGIYYYFEHQDGEHKLVLKNPPSTHKPCQGQSAVRFLPTSNGVRQDDVINSCVVEQTLLPGSFAHADYNFERPQSQLLVQLSGDNPFEIYDYPGGFLDSGEGDKLARVRLEEQTAQTLVLTGASDCRALASGFEFEFKDHPRAELNQAWFLTEVVHSASFGENYETSGAGSPASEMTYSNSFKCIPAEVPFRPPRVTPQPQVHGCHTAVVVGPSGETIHPDDRGRVKVQFHWDRLGSHDDNSSCWIRVSQPWAGSGWGGMFIPHTGQEVVITYEEGNPDRPLITGRLYNAATMPYIGLPAGKTRSVISDHGGNELIMEGDGGKQQIRIGSPKQDTFMTIGAANSPEGFNFGSAAHMSRKLGGDDMLTASGNQLADIIGNVTQTTGGSKSATIAGKNKAMIGGSSTEMVGGSGTSVIAGRSSLNVGGKRTEVVGGAHSIANPKMSINSRSKCSVVAGSKIDEKAPALNMNGTSKVNVKSGGPIKQQASGLVSVKAGGPLKQQSSGPMNLKADGVIKQQAGGAMNLKAGGALNQQGSNVNVKGPTKIAGETKITKATKIKGNTLTIS